MKKDTTISDEMMIVLTHWYEQTIIKYQLIFSVPA
jgi:hypothetical protein